MIGSSSGDKPHSEPGASKQLKDKEQEQGQSDRGLLYENDAG